MTSMRSAFHSVSRGGASRGFSVVELLVVVGITMVIAAIAVPQGLRALRTYRLTAAVGEASTLIQRTRYEAIRNNRAVPLRWNTTGGRVQMWIDLNNNSAYDSATEPTIFLPEGFQFPSPSGAPAVSSMGYTTTATPTSPIVFDGRGMVTAGGPQTVLVMCMGNPNRPDDGFRAISLLPTGRAKTWRATSGSSWYE
jgi:Tfp pilus assembly protein FimT